MEGGRGGEERGENGVFFPPLPSPSPILNPSTSPLKTLFDSSQLSGSINVQDGGTTSFLKTIHGSLQNTPALQASVSARVRRESWDESKKEE